MCVCEEKTQTGTPRVCVWDNRRTVSQGDREHVSSSVKGGIAQGGGEGGGVRSMEPQ